MRYRFATLASTVLTLSLAAASSLAAQAAAATMPICKDGSTSSVAGRGACSGHGGVDAKATDAAKKAAAKTSKTTTKAAATADKAADKAADKTAKASATAAKADAKAADKAADKAVDAAAKTKPASAASKSDNTDPTNATAQCKDGTYSHAKTHQGACSNHGGVAKFLK